MRYTKEEIGSILRTLRQNAGMTQKDVANTIERTQQIVGHWETGYSQPDADTLFLLCDLYGVSIDEAFGFQTNESISKHELSLLENYRKLDTHGRNIINAVLDIEVTRIEAETTDTVRVFKAARSSDDTEPGMVEIPRSTIEKLKAAEPAEKI